MLHVRGAIEPPREPDRCPASDRGAGALEYAALIILAGILLGGIYWGLGQVPFTDKARQAICAILHIEDSCSAGDDDDGAEKPNYLPVYCDALVKSESQNLTAKFAWFSFGENFTLIWEKLANGEVWITVVPHDYKIGGDFKVGQNIDVGGDIHLSMGDTYQFQSNDEAEKWMETLRNNVNEHNPMSWRFWNIFDGGEAETPDPVIEATTIGIGATAEAGFQLPGKVLDLGPHIRGSFSGDVVHEKWHLWDPKKHRYWDNTSNTFKMSGEVDVGLAGQTNDKVPGKGKTNLDKKLKWTAAIRYMYNPDGTLANIRWITTYENGKKGGGNYGHGGPHAGANGEQSNEITRMDQLNFDNPNDFTDPVKKAEAERQQQVGHDYIDQYGGIPPVPILNAIQGKNEAVTEDPGLDADPFTRMMYDKGKSWQWESDNSTFTTEGGTPLHNMEGAPALEFSTSNTTKATTDAQYLGEPKDGHREYVDFPACEADKVPDEHDWRLDGY